MDSEKYLTKYNVVICFYFFEVKVVKGQKEMQKIF